CPGRKRKVPCAFQKAHANHWRLGRDGKWLHPHVRGSLAGFDPRLLMGHDRGAMGLHKPSAVLLDALVGGTYPASAVVVAPGFLDAAVAFIGPGEAVVRHEKAGVEPQGAV